MITLDKNLGPLAGQGDFKPENTPAYPAESRAKYPAALLDFNDRSKGRQRVILSDGTEALILQDRGRVFRDQDLLSGPENILVLVKAKNEPVVTAFAQNWPQLCLAAYHFGNRHAAVELGQLSITFYPDRVLEEMAGVLGLKTQHHLAPFQPQSGPYLGSHDQGASHSHDQSHDHNHNHGHNSDPGLGL
jgi:urease accessory protein